MGPENACRYFQSITPDADSYRVTLYGSLALTGRGHGSDVAIQKTIVDKPVEVIFDTETGNLPHENTMLLVAIKDGEVMLQRRIMSIGGGDIIVEGEGESFYPEVYEEQNFAEIKKYCKTKGIRLSEYVFEKEGEEMRSYLHHVWQVMKGEIAEGLAAEGILPGGLGVQRVAKLLYNRRHIDERPETREQRLVCAYAFAAAENNAACGIVVTAPTCGACAVLPAVMKYMQEKHNLSDDRIVDALAVGGIIGNVVKQNASISGAECGCQAEIGTACSMTAAALGELFEMDIDQIEYAAEMSLEHMLGLTCDPICGLVQIPCIERNAVAAMRAINSVSMANFLMGTRKISFDMVVRTMYETGRDLHPTYRETSTGGLAKLKL